MQQDGKHVNLTILKGCGVAHREDSFLPTKRGANALIATQRTLKERLFRFVLFLSQQRNILIALSITERPPNALQVGIGVINHVSVGIFTSGAVPYISPV